MNVYGKKFLVWLLVSMISVSALAGCGNAGAKTKESSGTAEETKHKTEEGTAEETKQENAEGSAGEEKPENGTGESKEQPADESASQAGETAAQTGASEGGEGQKQENAPAGETAEPAAVVTLEVLTEKDLENLPEDVVIPVYADTSIGEDLTEDENGNAYTEEDYAHMADGDSIDGMPTPFVEYTDYESFREDVTIGLDEIRDLPFETDMAEWFLYVDGMYEITCTDEEGNSVCLRKAEGTADISGVYLDFDNVQIVKVNGRYMKFSGTGDEIQVAVWSDGTFTWSIYAEPGVPAQTMAEMAASVAP